MSMIENQIKQLENLKAFIVVNCNDNLTINEPMAQLRIINDAISTIQDLSAKLAAANMERSSAYYNGGWIPVEDLPPENKERTLIQVEKANWKTGDIEIFLHIAELDDNGEWLTACGTPNGKVTAWMPLPEPYKKEV